MREGPIEPITGCKPQNLVASPDGHSQITAASICGPLDRQKGDASRRKFDLTRGDVLTLEGGQFAIGA